MQAVVQHINWLLTQHDYVVVPGFGGFVANYRPASVHPVSHQMHPPSKSLAFNKKLTQNDGLLVHAIARGEELPVNDATRQIEDFVREAQVTLSRKDVLVLPGIGKLFMDLEDSLQFVQSTAANHLPESFGLPVLQAKPVLRKKLVDIDTAVPVLEDTEEESKRIRPAWWAAAAMVLVLLGAGILYMTVPSVQDKANGLFGIGNGFDSVEVTDQPVEVAQPEMKDAPYSHMTEYWPLEITPIPDPEPIQVEVEKVEPAPVKRESPLLEPYFVEANHNMPKGFFAIVGSFKKPQNADNYKKTLAEDGYDTFLFPTTKNGFVRVGVYLSPNDQSKANDSIFSIRTAFQPDAWLVLNR